MNYEEPKMSLFKKILIVLITLTVILALISYYAFFHTALPAKAVVSLLNQSDNISINGINGSLSSGFDVETIRLTDSDGNINSLDDIKLHYKSASDSISITEFHVGNGYFYIDFSNLNTTSDKESTSSDNSTSTETTNEDPFEQNFIIERLSINNITLEDIKTGEQFKLNGLQIENLVLGKDTKLGKLLVESSSCHIEVSPLDDSNGQKYSIKALLKPTLHKNILKNIDLNGSCYVEKNTEVKLDLVAFDKKVKINGNNLIIDKLTLSDFLDNSPPLKELSLNVTSDENKASAKGSFLFAEKLFTIDQETSKPKEKVDIEAHFNDEEVNYKLVFPMNNSSFFQRMRIETSPSMATKDAIAMLVTSKKFNKLTTTENERLLSLLKYFEDATSYIKK